MKKTILVMASLVCIFTVGCSSRITKAGSLNDSYFELVDKLENKEEISKKYIKNLLSG